MIIIYVPSLHPLSFRMCEIIEKETENYMKLDQDPFDDRHPARVDPECDLGYLMTVLFKKDDFMNQVCCCCCCLGCYGQLLNNIRHATFSAEFFFSKQCHRKLKIMYKS